MRTHAAHDSLGPIDRDFVGLVLGEDPIPFLGQHRRDPFRHASSVTGGRDGRHVLKIFDERQADVDLVLLHGPPDRRKPLVETGERVDTEEAEQAPEPPSMIDVGEPQPDEPSVGLFTVLLDVDLGTSTLLDDGPDGRRHRQHDEQKHGQLDGGEQLDHLG